MLPAPHLEGAAIVPARILSGTPTEDRRHASDLRVPSAARAAHGKLTSRVPSAVCDVLIVPEHLQVRNDSSH